MSAKLFTWLDLLDSFVAPHLFTTVLLLSAHFFPGLPGALESLWATAATGVFELHRFSKKEDVTQPSCTSQHITSMCSRASCHATFPGRQHWCPIHSAQSNADTLDTLGQLSLRKRNTPQTTTDHTLSCHCARRDRNEASLFLNA